MKRLFTTALCAFSFTANAASIIGLGDLAGGISFSQAFGVSADGSTVVGFGFSALGSEAFVYQNGVMTGIGDLGDAGGRTAFGVSADGSVVVGRASSASGAEAFVYQNGVMTGIGELAGGRFSSEALAISADGSTVVGRSVSASGTEAFVYQNRVMTGIGDLAGGSFSSQALAVSADGSTVVGSSDSASGAEAFVYQNGVMTGIGDLPGGDFSSIAFDISADGSTVVGSSVVGSNSAFGFIAPTQEAFVYQNGVMTGLGNLSGGIDSGALAVSADGSTIVGSSTSASGSGSEAVLWSEDGNGGFNIASLQDRLFLLGIDIAADGWIELFAAHDISDDGRFITGSGVRNGNREAFLVDLGATAVPIPAAAWLFGSALIGLVGLKRKQ